MHERRRIPEDPLGFIKRCIERKRIFWTYHVNMRLGQRGLTRAAVLAAADSFLVIEEYPEDKYLPSYLVRADHQGMVFHVQIAADAIEENIRIVTAYIPDPAEWDKEFRVRREPR